MGDTTINELSALTTVANADVLAIYDADEAVDEPTKKVTAATLAAFCAGGIEYIYHTVAGAIAPTSSIVVVIVGANITLPAITDTPRIIGMLFFDAYTVTTAGSDVINRVSTSGASVTMASKEALILASTNATTAAWIPLAFTADVSVI